VKAARSAIVLAVFFVALPVAADAPIEPPSERQYEDFTDQDQRIVDHFTRLAWARNVPAPMNHNDARTFCSGGAPPVRLPTLKELLTLVDEEPNPVYDIAQGREIVKHIDRRAFGGVVGQRAPVDLAYWTSSLDTNGRVFTVSFADATTITEMPTVQLRVRCVQALP
jgi:hypothetical protein